MPQAGLLLLLEAPGFSSGLGHCEHSTLCEWVMKAWQRGKPSQREQRGATTQSSQPAHLALKAWQLRQRETPDCTGSDLPQGRIDGSSGQYFPLNLLLRNLLGEALGQGMLGTRKAPYGEDISNEENETKPAPSTPQPVRSRPLVGRARGRECCSTPLTSLRDTITMDTDWPPRASASTSHGAPRH